MLAIKIVKKQNIGSENILRKGEAITDVEQRIKNQLTQKQTKLQEMWMKKNNVKTRTSFDEGIYCVKYLGHCNHFAIFHVLG